MYVPLHETQFGEGAGDDWPTLSNEIFKSDNPTEPPSHEPSFHSVISSLPRRISRGDVASIGSRLIGPTGLKGISKTLRTLARPFPPFFHAILSQQVWSRVWIAFFFFSFFLCATKGEGSGVFVHWKVAVEKFERTSG